MHWSITFIAETKSTLILTLMNSGAFAFARSCPLFPFMSNGCLITLKSLLFVLCLHVVWSEGLVKQEFHRLLIIFYTERVVWLMEDVQLSQCKEKFKSLCKTKNQTNMDRSKPNQKIWVFILSLGRKNFQEKVHAFIQGNNYFNHKVIQNAGKQIDLLYFNSLLRRAF